MRKHRKMVHRGSSYRSFFSYLKPPWSSEICSFPKIKT
ncbi:hypothetical protein SLEP1_g42386 [Rubroshorea leprosula]|uniref:Uncharacterized protein n=1 Tax=Rubroshorea leprosula TaxID=152421 RepID=A0AAV5LAA4_9ROSI|nr:hypothetical protein SLEP1_g42386 [Rubroshorea leprosula]